MVLTNTEIPGHRPPWIPLYQTLALLAGANFVFGQVLASRRMRRSSMGFGGCFMDLDLIDGEFVDLFIAPLLGTPNRIASLVQFLVQMKFARLDRFAKLHGKLTMPVAFLWGAADPTFPEPTARAMTSQFPNVACGFHSIPNGKLFIQEEFPDQLAALAADCFSRSSQ
jgi:haloalkane dehalogenase